MRRGGGREIIRRTIEWQYYTALMYTADLETISRGGHSHMRCSHS